MGETGFEQKAMVRAVSSAVAEQEQEAELRVATPGGRFQVRWDEGGSATALGQLAFFAEFLEVSGLFARWTEGCPMAYSSPNAPPVRDVLGTWLLCRYSMGSGATHTLRACGGMRWPRRFWV